MGKGTINSHIADGLYSIDVNYHTDRVQAWLALFAQNITIIENKIALIENDITELQAELAGLDPNDEDYQEEADNLTQLIIEEQSSLISQQMRKLSIEKRIEYLNAHAPDDSESMQVWCADLTEDLSGEIGTIEIPGEVGTILIQPGYDGNAAYDSNRDGQLQPVLGGTPASNFYNYAMLPGWQKWKPTYRFGTITEIDNGTDTCTVQLDTAYSSAQSAWGLNINQNAILNNVPFDYMDCNGSEPFEIGDEVVIKFTNKNFATPVVIGYKTDPQECCDCDAEENINYNWDDYQSAYYTSLTDVFRLVLEGGCPPFRWMLKSGTLNLYQRSSDYLLSDNETDKNSYAIFESEGYIDVDVPGLVSDFGFTWGHVFEVSVRDSCNLPIGLGRSKIITDGSGGSWCLECYRGYQQDAVGTVTKIPPVDGDMIWRGEVLYPAMLPSAVNEQYYTDTGAMQSASFSRTCSRGIDNGGLFDPFPSLPIIRHFYQFGDYVYEIGMFQLYAAYKVTAGSVSFSTASMTGSIDVVHYSSCGNDGKCSEYGVCSEYGNDDAGEDPAPEAPLPDSAYSYFYDHFVTDNGYTLQSMGTDTWAYTMVYRWTGPGATPTWPDGL